MKSLFSLGATPGLNTNPNYAGSVSRLASINQLFGLPGHATFEELKEKLSKVLTTSEIYPFVSPSLAQVLVRVTSSDVSSSSLTSSDFVALESLGRQVQQLSESNARHNVGTVTTPLGIIEVPVLEPSQKDRSFSPHSLGASSPPATQFGQGPKKVREVMEMKPASTPKDAPGRKKIISDWLDRIAGEDATKKRPIQKILLACNGLAATRLVDGINSLSAEIASTMGYDVTEPLIDMVAMAGPSDVEAGAAYLGRLSGSSIESVPEKVETGEFDKDGKPVTVRVFLHYETILACAAKHGVDAIAVGWGWVSEHAEFVRLAESRGFKVIAPTADAMQKLGGKIESKLLAEEADVSVLPWTRRPAHTVQEAKTFARNNDYKVVIKATAGGGGRGIRLVKGIDDPEINYQLWDKPIEESINGLDDQYFDVFKNLRLLPPQYNLEVFAQASVDEKKRRIKVLRLLNLLYQRSLQEEGEPSDNNEHERRMSQLIQEAEEAIAQKTDAELTSWAQGIIRDNHVGDLFLSAQNEGLTAFKDKTVFLEVLAPDNARHIEVQVDGDEYGNVRTLLERDCSLQLRRQKVCEEGPAIFIKDALRKEMREAAKRIARKAGYTNLGTCEFLCDGESYWFMEMNTRLQVEHPVTEMLTGLDLVKIQLKNAMGVRKTPQELEQWEDVMDVGRYVVATRVTAKDPDKRFAGSSGDLHEIKAPELPGGRTYFGVTVAVPTSSDPQIGHIFTVAATRGQAIALNAKAQQLTVVKGDVSTTLPFTIAVMQNGEFQEGTGLTISWLQGRADEYETRPHASDGPVALISTALYHFEQALRESQMEYSRGLEEGRRYPPEKLLSQKTFTLPFAQREYEVSVKKLDQGLYAVTCGGVTAVVHWINNGKDYLLTVNQQTHQIAISGKMDALKVQLNGHLYEGVSSDPTRVKSAITGSVWRVYVKVGDRVQPGTPLANIVAMKMENVVEADIPATVKAVHTSPDTNITPGALLVELEPIDNTLVVEPRQAAIQLDAAWHVPLFDAGGLEKHLGTFSWEDRQKMLLGFLEGGSFFADALVVTNPKKPGRQPQQENTSLSVMLAAYQNEATLLETEWKKLTPDLQEAILNGDTAGLSDALQSLSRRMREHVARVHDLVERFVALEASFQKEGESYYVQHKDKAYQEATRRKNIKAHLEVIVTLLRQVRDLPYHIRTRGVNITAHLDQMSRFKGDAFRELRALSRDLYRIAHPPSRDNFNTTERVRAAAQATEETRKPLIDSLLSAPMLSSTDLVNLMMDPDTAVRSVAAHVLVKRTYEGVKGDSERTKRHQVVEGSVRVQNESGKDYCRWEFIDRKSGHRRLGIAVLPDNSSLEETIYQAAAKLAAERRTSERQEDAVEVLVPPGVWPAEDTETVLNNVHTMLETNFGEPKPKRITFSVWHAGKPTEYFSFTSEDGVSFVEQKRFRGLDPLRAYLLEMSRWREFDTRKIPSDHRSIHSWVCEKREAGHTDRRLTTRALVFDAGMQPGSALPALERVYREAVEISQQDMDRLDKISLQHLFFNVLTPINADFESVSVALGKMVAQVQKETRIRSHYKVEVKAEVRDPASTNGQYREVVFVFDLSGPSLRGKAYYVFGPENNRQRIRWDVAEQANFVSSNFPPEAIRQMGVAYKTKSDLTLKRERRELQGRYYVYDRPEAMKHRLATRWEAAGERMPEDAFEAVELAMVDGNLQEVKRNPGANDCAIVGWQVRCRYPRETGMRTFYWASADFTYEYGSVAPNEGAVFSAIVRRRAIPENRPFLVGAEGSGARILLDRSLIVEKPDGSYHSYLKYDEAGHYIYLNENDYEVPPASPLAKKNPELKRLGDLVTGEWVERPLSDDSGRTEKVYRVRTILGGDGDLNTENLTQGSGLMAGAAQEAYGHIPTFAMVTDVCAGIWAYIVRLVKRVAQCRQSPQLLTGKDSLNGLYGRTVYTDNEEIGGLNVMTGNGVTQFEASDEDQALDHFLNWLEFVPASKENPDETRPQPEDLYSRDVAAQLLGSSTDPQAPEGIILDKAGGVKLYDPRDLVKALFDKDTWVEQSQRWASGIVTGRAYLGGLPTGVIAFDPRTFIEVIPSDPTNPQRSRLEVPRPGLVWHAQAAYKTAQFLMDNEQEGLPTVILPNLKGFPGGSFDLGPEAVTKYGALIVEALQKVKQGRRIRMPVVILIPPYAEVRGGAQVVIDRMINENSIVVLMDEKGEMSVLPPSGMISLSMIRKREAAFRSLGSHSKAALQTVIEAHQTAERAQHVGSVDRILPTSQLRSGLYDELKAAMEHMSALEEREGALNMLRQLAQIAGVQGNDLPDIIAGVLQVIQPENPYYPKLQTVIRKAQA